VLHVGGVGSRQITKTINNMLLWACMVANFESLSLLKARRRHPAPGLRRSAMQGRQLVALAAGARATGKWAEKDMDVALELAQHAKMPMPLAGLVDQLVKHINQEKMKALLS